MSICSVIIRTLRLNALKILSSVVSSFYRNKSAYRFKKIANKKNFKLTKTQNLFIIKLLTLTEHNTVCNEESIEICVQNNN